MRYIDSGERDSSQALGNWLLGALSEDVVELRCQSGFFSFGGVGLFIPTIDRLVSQNRVVNVLIGANEGSTLRNDIQRLMTRLGIPGSITSKLGIISFSGGAFFHPKVYHLRYSDGKQSAYVGSANLTESGVASLHVEAGVVLDTRDGDDEITLSNIATAIDNWFMGSRPGFTLVNSLTVLDQLVSDGVIAVVSPPRATTSTGGVSGGRAGRPRLRPLIELPNVPTLPVSSYPFILDELVGVDFEIESPVATASVQSGSYSGFLMILQKTDVGVGQTTAGTSRRSPEIFIPLSARNYDPVFWGWPLSFTQDLKTRGKMDRHAVMRIGTNIVTVNMMTWPIKHDFRLRNESLRSAGNIGDILRIERTDGQGGFEYYVEVIPQGTTHYAHYLALCINPVRNSGKRWGYY